VCFDWLPDTHLSAVKYHKMSAMSAPPLPPSLKPAAAYQFGNTPAYKPLLLKIAVCHHNILGLPTKNSYKVV